MEVEEGFRWHVTLGSSSVLNFHLLLKLDNFNHFGIVLMLGVTRVAGHMVHLNLRKAEVNQQAGSSIGVV